MSIDHLNAKNVWFTIEGSVNGLKNVVVVETNLHVDARHPDYDDKAMTSLLEAVQRFLEHFRFILVHTHLRQSSFGILGY
jgi:hypothetical protein